MAKWALIALIAPEVVLVCAYFQWLQARRLCRQLEAQMPENVRIQWNEMSPHRSLRHTISALFWQLVEALDSMARGKQSKAGSWFTGWVLRSKKKVPLVYGYYAVMGGFAIDTTEFNIPHQVNISKRMTITCSGLIALARAGVFLKIDRETINDKSKADVLAKGLVIFQVVWMVVQVRSLTPLRSLGSC
jgi:hypothetical protein